MTINDVIERMYDELSGHCKLGVIRGYHQTTYITDFEEIDILHSLIVRWLIKYKLHIFDDYDYIYNILKTQFLAEKNNYTKMRKVGTIYTEQLPEEKERDKRNDY